MSRTALIVALVVLALLSAALALVALRPAPRSAQAAAPRLADFADDRLDRLTILDGTPLEIRRGPMPDLWLMSEGAAGSQGGPVWPVPASRVRGLLRLLGEASTAPAAAPGPAEPPAASAEFRLVDGGVRTLRVLGTPIAGRATVAVETSAGAASTVSAPADVVGLLRRDSVLEWRSAAALPAGSAGASRLGVAPPGGAAILLGRVGDRWALLEPAAAPADAPAVASALRALDEILITRFRQEAPPAGAPGGAVTVEADQQFFDAAGLVRRTLVQRFEVVGSAGPESAIVRCTGLLRAPDGTLTSLWSFLGDARPDAVSRIPSAPSAYVSRVASGVARADVAGLSWTVNDRAASFRRDLESWLRRSPSGDAPATPDAVAQLQRLLELLTAARADRVLDAGTPFEPAVALTVLDARGEPLEMVELALLAPEQGQPAVAARSSGVVRVYTGPGARPVFDWLVEHARDQAR